MPTEEECLRRVPLCQVLSMTASKWLPEVQIVALHCKNTNCCSLSQHGKVVRVKMPIEKYQMWRGPDWTRSLEYNFNGIDFHFEKDNVGQQVPQITLEYMHHRDLYDQKEMLRLFKEQHFV